MGLDIYAGTLTRYYGHNWKTVSQQWAEANGFGYQRFNPQGEKEQEEELSPAQIQDRIEEWRDQLLTALTRPDQPPYTPWPEDNEKPYYTEKPDWDAFGAMLLVAACRTYGEPVPETIPKGWDFMEHPLIARLAEDNDKVWSLFRGVSWWLPLPDGIMFQAYLPNDDLAPIATTGALRMELESLNNMAWQAGEETILEWIRTEGYPADAQIGSDGRLQQDSIQEHTQYSTESLAKFAFSVFYQALRFAEENQTPVLMDF